MINLNYDISGYFRGNIKVLFSKIWEILEVVFLQCAVGKDNQEFNLQIF